MPGVRRLECCGMSGEDEIEREAARLGAARRPVRVDEVRPMLADTADAPFSSAEWVFELKYDGYRFLASRAGEEVRLLTRSGRDAAATFPEVADVMIHIEPPPQR